MMLASRVLCLVATVLGVVSHVQALCSHTGAPLYELRCYNVTLQEYKKAQTEYRSTETRSLIINGSPLKNLTRDMFDCEAWAHIREVNLKNNTLHEIESGVFKLFEILENINLAHNNLTTLNVSVFKTNRQLGTLDLSHNKLTRFAKPEEDSEPFIVSVLNLSKNNLTHIHKDWYTLFPMLQKLDLSGNNFTNIHAVFNTTVLRDLRELNLAENNLSTIQNGTFQKQLLNLANLSLASCNISYLEPYAFAGLSLEMLDMRNNKLSSVTLGSLQQLFTLKRLNLAENPIGRYSLKHGTFSGLSSLTYLDLSNCSFENFSPGLLFPLEELVVLILDKNYLVDLFEKDFTDNFPKLKYVSINNNTIPCSPLERILRFFQHNRIDFLFQTRLEYLQSNIAGIACTE